MSGRIEVVVTSENSGQSGLSNACIWDPKTGTTLMTYKGGGTASPHALSLVGKDYLVTNDNVRPLLHAWQLNSQQPVSSKGTRLVCPGRVSSLAVSPNGDYCVTAVAEKLHVWQFSSGRHIAVVERHYQPVYCIRFTDDGSHFVSGGEDSLVLVWRLAYLVGKNDLFPGQVEPCYVFSDHSQPVRDLYVGPGGIRAHLISVSVDRHCKLYDLASGTLLLSLIFDSGLTAVTMDTPEHEVFVGDGKGDIIQFGLCSPPRVRDYYLTKDQKSKIFTGHKKAISSLSTSKDGLTLLSGSFDATVMLWNIPSRQCVRIMNYKGPVTNAFFVIMPENVLQEDVKPTLVLQNLQRSSEPNDNTVCLIRAQQWSRDDLPEDIVHVERTVVEPEEEKLEEEINALKKVNLQLYEFARKNILKSAYESTAYESNRLLLENGSTGETSVQRSPYLVKAKKKQKKISSGKKF